jgi:hypothetical protein
MVLVSYVAAAVAADDDDDGVHDAVLVAVLPNGLESPELYK